MVAGRGWGEGTVLELDDDRVRDGVGREGLDASRSLSLVSSDGEGRALARR